MLVAGAGLASEASRLCQNQQWIRSFNPEKELSGTQYEETEQESVLNVKHMKKIRKISNSSEL